MVKTTHEESDDLSERVPVGSLKNVPYRFPAGYHDARHPINVFPIARSPIVRCKYCGGRVDITLGGHWGRDAQGNPWKYVNHQCNGTHGHLRIHPKRLAPLDDVLAQWVISDWPCLALDSCEVEPDGTCEHGFPSWLTYLQPRLYID